MLAALSSQAAGGARQAVGGTLACLAAGLQRRGFAAAAKGDSDTVTVEVGRPKTRGQHRSTPPLCDLETAYWLHQILHQAGCCGYCAAATELQEQQGLLLTSAMLNQHH
jgi:hypothetical protein